MYNLLIILLIIFIIISLVLLGFIFYKLSKLEKNNTYQQLPKEENNLNSKNNQDISLSQDLKEYKDLKQKMQELIDQEKNLKNIIVNLNNQRELLSNQLNSLENEINIKNKEIEKLNNEIQKINKEIEKLQNEKDKIISDNEKLIEKAKKDAEEITKKAMEKFELINKEWDKIDAIKLELWEKEKQLSVKLKEIDIKKEELAQKQQEILTKEKEIEEKMNYVNQLKAKAEEELLKISNLTPEAAKEIVIKKTEENMKTELLIVSQKIEQEYIKNAEAKAKRILLNALSRITVDSVAENTTSSVVLPSEELKGRIIGKEGRNIKAFEEITGVDLIIDDNSEVVLVSSFDPIRREKARLTLEKLISIGKINPIAIQEVYDQIEKEINLKIQEEGENAAIQAKVYDLHPDLITILGKMKYRTSYGQNLLKHSIQVSQIATLLATELGADVEVCRRAALLHDIGKVLEETNGEPHAIAGAKIAKIYGEKEEVVRAIASHHNEVPQETLEDLIVQIADAISASRPGARKETYQLYIQRLQKLEEIAMSFNGVEKAYVLQGGKEVIVFVKPDMVLDNEVYKLAKDIAKAIENNLKYPGLIRVTVIRKIIAVQTAK